MSNELIPFGNHDLTTRDSRRVGRAISRNRGGALVRISGVNADGDTAQEKLHELTMATGTAMAAVARVGQAEEHLKPLLTSQANRRITHLAEDHALGMAEVLAELRRDLRRR